MEPGLGAGCDALPQRECSGEPNWTLLTDSLPNPLLCAAGNPLENDKAA
jgi:hypothetical protein